MKSNTPQLTIYTQFTSLLREKYGKVTGKENNWFLSYTKRTKMEQIFLALL